jgi:glycosyltransferase involved in cell wall biosynthesis
MVEITVIMPVYNGERWLAQTLNSLKNQTFQDFEVLCVDDCSGDSSYEILQHFAAQDARFKVLRCPTNQGIVPKVINFAKSSVRGNYFVYTSQDDLFSTDWLEAMLLAMRATHADAVLPDLEFFLEGGVQNKRLIGLDGDRSVVLSGREAFLLSLDWKISGNALWPTRFLHDPGFSDFGTFADEYSVRHFYLHCKKVAFCDGLFFYRQDNPDAITKKVSPKLLDAADNNYRLWRLCRDHGFAEDVLAVRAFYTLRSLIKAQALIYDHQELRAQAALVEQCFASIQSADFSESLQHYLVRNTGLVKRAMYGGAQRSRRWLDTAALLSSLAGRIKRRN